MTGPELRPDRVLGAGHDTFWAFCTRGELRLQRCRSCRHLSWPPVASGCEQCSSTKLDWKRLSGRGFLISWCTFERDYYRDGGPIPWETILVELEEGPVMVSNPHLFDLSAARLGLPLQVAFVTCADRDGPFLLPVFERAADA